MGGREHVGSRQLPLEPHSESEGRAISKRSGDVSVASRTEGLYSFAPTFFLSFWLHWVFVAAGGLSLAAASTGYSLL